MTTFPHNALVLVFLLLLLLFFIYALGLLLHIFRIFIALHRTFAFLFYSQSQLEYPPGYTGKQNFTRQKIPKRKTSNLWIVIKLPTG
jgi:hypothetical protein